MRDEVVDQWGRSHDVIGRNHTRRDDVLGIQFWRDQDMSGDVTVRPDGMITLPLIRDMKAAVEKLDKTRTNGEFLNAMSSM